MKFSELDIPSDILGALEKMGFEEMTPVQEAAYPIIAEGHDLCALAETGSERQLPVQFLLFKKWIPRLMLFRGL